MPIAHGEGRYHVDPATLRTLIERNQVVFRYATETGEVTAAANPNGSTWNIAGVCNEDGTVLGLMPHPERAAEPAVGSTDGLALLNSLLGSLVENGSALGR
jgi:phosphoribosylformylglycinamidine synthase